MPTDFAAAVKQSVLPLMLREAQRGGFKLCLVRVQRRPLNGQPPDPAMTLDMYEDGDHIARRARADYTRLFYERLRVLFRAAPRANNGAPAAQ